MIAYNKGNVNKGILNHNKVWYNIKHMKDRTWQEINLKNLKHNYDLVCKYAKDKTIIPMIKDNAYGHGSFRVAKVLEKEERVKAFAVAMFSEAKELKDSDIKKDIILIGHIYKDCFEEAIKNDFILTISTIDQAILINDVAKKLHKIARIEIAIDSGMRRIGFLINDESLNYIKKISSFENIFIYGVFSHFSVADSDINDLDSVKYTDNQEKVFFDFVNKIRELGVDLSDVSLSNSAGILRGRGMEATSVRPGIILYGIRPSSHFNEIGLKPVMSLKSKIMYIKEVPENTSISYGRTYVSNRKMKIATICCGYGDGYPRSASNAAKVIINDKICDIIGRVTMDMLVVDVTNIDCKLYDEVILIGESESHKISLDDLCNATGEFTYEMLTRINKRVEQIFIE